MAAQAQHGSILFGFVFIGVWLGVAILEEPSWWLWGLFGLALGGGLYAAKAASDTLRMVLWGAVGLGIGLLLTMFLLDRQEGFLATLVTFVGAGLVATGLPTPRQGWKKA